MSARTFHYTARTLDGAAIRGSMHAADAGNVLQLLRSRSLFVTGVQPQSEWSERLGRALRIGAIRPPALLAFFRSFATLLRAGIPIQRALTVTIERANDARMAETLSSVRADVEGGVPLSAALQRHPRDFPALFVAMIAAGETGGILEEVLERLALLLEREALLRNKLRAVLAYPLIVTLAAGALLVFLIVNVVPMFAQLFDSFHAALPPATQLLVAAGRILAAPQPWLFAAAALPLAGFAAARTARTPAGAQWIDHLRLRIPVVGPLLHKSITARTMRMLATLLRSGVELVSAIEAVIPVSGSPAYARAFTRIVAALRAGEPLADTLADSLVFDPLVAALVRVGEETGLLDDMLVTLAEYFESDVEAAIATLGAVIEPALILVLGVVVGCIVLSIFLPLYSLIGSVSK
jgi:type IV pilus assembly protein PilC